MYIKTWGVMEMCSKLLANQTVPEEIGSSSAARRTSQQLPLLVWAVIVCTAVAFYGGTFFGFNLSGLAWVIPLGISVGVITTRFSRISFPTRLWLPWILLLFLQLFFVNYDSLDPRVIPLQRTLQICCPTVVGMAMSTYRPTSAFFNIFQKALRWLLLSLVVIFIIKIIVVLQMGYFDNYSGMAAEMMTVMLLCTFLANRFLLLRNKRDLFLWCLLLLVPVVNVTRTVIVATVLTLPLAFAPMRLYRRVLLLTVIVAIGVTIFYSPRVQKKMFYKGKGNLSDITGADFATSGRLFIWQIMLTKNKEESLFGHGTGAGETLTYQITRKTAYPHNDWLLTYYDYGMTGVVVLALCIASSMVHALYRAGHTTNIQARLFLYSGAAAFVPFIMVMFTDNILVYTSFFGNLHFTMLGLGYGTFRAQQLTVKYSS